MGPGESELACGSVDGGAQRRDAEPQRSAQSKREVPRPVGAGEGAWGNSEAWGPEGDAPGRAERGLSGPAGLPSRNKNNCATYRLPGEYRLTRTATIYGYHNGEGVRIDCEAEGKDDGFDNAGRHWRRSEDGKTWVTMEPPSPPERKGAFALRRNVEAFSEHYRREQCGFLTLTTREDLNPREFAQRWHKMRRRRLPWIRSYIRVLEPQERGAPHWHLLVATPFDLKPNAFDWEALWGAAAARKKGDLGTARALTKEYARNAPPELRKCWAELRRWCSRYGLGRSEFLPFRKAEAAVAEYIGKYLEAGLHFRRGEWKGCRRVECDRREAASWRRCSRQFSWASPGAAAWRKRLGELAVAAGGTDFEGLRRRFGQNWCYRLRGMVIGASASDWETFISTVVSEVPPGPLQPRTNGKMPGVKCE